jgi:hypothetical protein
VNQPKPPVTTRFVVELEDMDDATAGAFGLWLQMMINDETDHQVQRLIYQRNCPWNPDELSGR